jgi:hypothetical protein
MGVSTPCVAMCDTFLPTRVPASVGSPTLASAVQGEGRLVTRRSQTRRRSLTDHAL